MPQTSPPTNTNLIRYWKHIFEKAADKWKSFKIILNTIKLKVSWLRELCNFPPFPISQKTLRFPLNYNSYTPKAVKQFTSINWLSCRLYLSIFSQFMCNCPCSIHPTASIYHLQKFEEVNQILWIHLVNSAFLCLCSIVLSKILSLHCLVMLFSFD